MKDIEYKGYKIQKESEPWALKYGMEYRYFIDGERIRNGKTIEECKELIDEYGLNKTCPDCGGTGISIGTTLGCCGSYNPDGSCCGCAIPEPIQEQCHRCNATGYIEK